MKILFSVVHETELETVQKFQHRKTHDRRSVLEFHLCTFSVEPMEQNTFFINPPLTMVVPKLLENFPGVIQN